MSAGAHPRCLGQVLITQLTLLFLPCGERRGQPKVRNGGQVFLGVSVALNTQGVLIPRGVLALFNLPYGRLIPPFRPVSLPLSPACHPRARRPRSEMDAADCFQQIRQTEDCLHRLVSESGQVRTRLQRVTFQGPGRQIK